MPRPGEIGRLATEFAEGRLSPLDHAAELLDRVAREDCETNAFCLVDREVTLAMAREADARHRAGRPLGALDGIPVTIKDTIDVAGWPTRRGSRTSSPEPVPSDAVSIARLRAAGAVFLGKTTTPEFAWKGLTDSPLHGITRNPLDLALTAGGSSGGAAAAAALDLGTVHLGTDAAGSVRIPAAFCGVAAYKPTFGAIPLHPFPVSFFRLPHIGPITRTVADAALAARVMAGPAPSDPASLTCPPLPSWEQITATPSLCIGVATVDPSELEPAVAQLWAKAVAALADAGVLQEVRVPFHETRDVVASLYRLGCASAVDRVSAERRADLDPEVLAFVAPVRDLSGKAMAGLIRRREELAVEAATLLAGDIDVLVSPTMPCLPPAADKGAGTRDAEWMSWCPFTPYFNLGHGPALSVPWQDAGHDAASGTLPIGIQVGAAPGRDAAALYVAGLIEELAARSF